VTDRRGRSVFEGRIEAAAPDGRLFDRIELQADGGVGEGRGASFVLLDADFALTEHGADPASIPVDDALIV